MSLAFIITLIWVGFLAAISFMEAPVKFTAPSLTLAVGLDVGQHVFAVLNKTEWVFITVNIILLFASKSTTAIKGVWGGIFLVLALQTFWLLPALDERVLIYINGGTPPPSPLHLAYIIVEVIKLTGLITVGILQVAAFGKALQKETIDEIRRLQIDIFA